MLVLHRSERADLLAGALGELLSGQVADPVVPEVVAVPTRGVERWLAQRLATRLGVCANVSMPQPAPLLLAATAAACGIDPVDDPWRPDRCVWTVVGLIDEHLDDPLLAPLAAHVRATSPAPRPGRPPGLRRYPVARRVVGLFDRYALERPAMLEAWRAGDRWGDGDVGGGWAPGEPWQSHLWRLLRTRLGVPGPAERTAEASRRIGADPGVVDLPDRLSLFGLTRMPPGQLTVLRAIATGRDVHLYLLHPSGALWDAIDPGAGAVRSGRRAEDPTARIAHHPLLRSWGRDARELQLVLAAGRSGGLDTGDHLPVPAAGSGPAASTLLARLQADIRANRPPPGGSARPGRGAAAVDARALLGTDDRTVQVHACHGRARQVEVLRDALLHLLADDPSLELRDVLVMCPDIEVFAPLLQAAFAVGPGEDDDDPTGLPRLRVRLADRSLRQTNPLLATAAALLDLAGGRVTATQVLALAAQPPVAERFGFEPDDLATIGRWVAGAGVRWGIDAAWRSPWGLGHVADSTWDTSIDRLLLGAAMTGGDDCRTFAGTVPYDDVPSGALDLAGRVAELVDRLRSALDALGGPLPVAGWVEAVESATSLVAVPPQGDEWQLEQLRDELAEVGTTVAGGSGPELSLDEARHLLSTRLGGRPTRANFRTGDLTVCTLVPMRSVPHRVIALLGLDDGTFPRHPEPDGDDLVAVDPSVGDRDPRSEDRQMLLDALLAATDCLVVTYSGRDERTNRSRPPAVPVAELLDAIDATVRTADGAPARAQVVSQHPLQSFDPVNFTGGGVGRPGPWGFDRVQLAGSVASGARRSPDPWLGGPLPPLDEPVLRLDDLVRFVEHPVRAFLRRRLDLYLGADADTHSDAVPSELDALERWGVGTRLLEARLAGTTIERAAAAERGRGLLPPGVLADELLADAGGDVERLVGALGGDAGPRDSLDVHVELPDGRSLVGTVPGVRRGCVVTCTFSRLGPKHRLAAWVRHLALTAARPDLTVETRTIGRGPGRGRPPSAAQLPALAHDSPGRRARALGPLEILLDLYDRGMREPLPLACATSEAWAAAVQAGVAERAYERAAERWKDRWVDDEQWRNEQSDPEHVLVWGAGRELRELGDLVPAGVAYGPWPEGGQGPVDILARRLWLPLLAVERVGQCV